MKSDWIRTTIAAVFVLAVFFVVAFYFGAFEQMASEPNVEIEAAE